MRSGARIGAEWDSLFMRLIDVVRRVTLDRR